MDGCSLHFVLLLVVSSIAGADFLPDRCACLSEEAVGALVAEGGDWASYPASYGVGCRAHDLNLTGCTCEPASKRCMAEWCWVDPKECTLNYERSTDFRGLARSYAACGHAVPPSSNHALDRRLKICPLANTGGYLGTYFDSIEEIYGAVPDLMKEALGDLHKHDIVTPEEFLTHCENSTLSRFNCCVWVTSLGICDICLTEATINAYRSEMVRFFPTSDEPRQIVIKVKEDGTKMFLGLLEPFTLEAWLVIVSVPLLSLASGCCTHLRVRVSDRAHPRAPHGRRRLRPRRSIATRDRLLCSCCRRFQLSIRHSPPSCGTLSLFALRMFIEVTLLLYGSANLFHHLTAEKLGASVETLADLRREGYVVGMQRTDAACFEGMNLRFGRDPVDGERHFVRRLDLLTQMDNGLIDVAVTTPQDLAVQHALGQHCGKRLVGEVLQSVPMGIPMTRMVADEISQILQKKRDGKAWSTIQKQARLPSKCTKDADPANQALPWQAVLVLAGAIFAIHCLGRFVDVYTWWNAPSEVAAEPDPEPELFHHVDLQRASSAIGRSAHVDETPGAANVAADNGAAIAVLPEAQRQAGMPEVTPPEAQGVCIRRIYPEP